MRRTQSPVAVEPFIGQMDQPVRPIIDIEQNGIEGGFSPVDDIVHVIHLDHDARIGEGVSEDMRQGAVGPCRDFRDEFRHGDHRRGWQRSSSRAQRKAHAQSADENSAVGTDQALAYQGGKRFFRMANLVSHQFIVAKADRIIIAATQQAQLPAVR